MDASKLVIKRVSLDASGKVVVKAKSPTPPRKSPKLPEGYESVTKVSRIPQARTNRKQLGRNGHWMFDKALCQDGQFGFIYLIHDTINERMYIGKKQYSGSGEKNYGQESNWKWYKSSCTQLKDVIRINGTEGFKFYVLEEYYIRGTVGFAESWSIMMAEAPANKAKWYNTLVNEVSWSVRESITNKHKDRLAKIIAGQADLLTVWSE